MKNTSLMTTGALVLLTAATCLPAEAAPAGQGVDQRQNPPPITQGIPSGQLTAPEARQLEHEQTRVHREQRTYRADGRPAMAGRGDSQGDASRAVHHVYNQEPDAQYRADAAPSHRVSVAAPGVDAQRFNQGAQIAQEVVPSTPTLDKGRDIAAGQKLFRADAHDDTADGVLTREERNNLREDLRVASRNIQGEKHDDGYR